MEEIDYKELLIKYIKVVCLAEGDDFIDKFHCGGMMSDNEYDELIKLSN